MTNEWSTEDLVSRAKKVLPGPQSNLRVPINLRPTFMVRGEGARLWDTDGKEYVDYMIAAGPGVLGHDHPDYLAALHRQLDQLLYSVSGATQTPMEVELAEKFNRHVPCAEKTRFALSGTEGVQLAIRLARAYTGRRIFIRFEGHYHGWLDNVLGGLVHEDPVANPHPYEGEGDPLGTAGRDPAAFEQCFRLPWNDVEVLEGVLERYGDQVALIHMEAINVNGGCILPRPGFLEKVRELSSRFGVVLSFDEVITGFRVALGGAQEVYGVTPDLATYGKALAAGMPISAVAGKAAIMDQLLEGKVVGAGTFNGYPLGITAALTTIGILEQDEGAMYRRVDAVQQRLVEGLTEIGTRRGIDHLIQGCRGVFLFHFTDLDAAWSVRDLAGADHQLQHKFRVNLAEEGVLIMWGGRWFVSAALTDADVDRTLEAADRAMAKL